MNLFESGVIRAARTFVQVFLATLLASGPLNVVSVSTLKAAALAGLAAVASLIMRLLDATPLQPLPPG